MLKTNSAGSAASRARTRPIGDRLHSAAIHLLRAVRVDDAQEGVTAPRLSVLSVLVFGGDRTIGELAVAEGVRPPTMTRLIDGLERDGLVKRSADATDARIVRVAVTKRGAALLHSARERRLARIDALLERCTNSELEALRTALDVVERELDRRSD
jgi:DNA-binding MarR family transcriptional regulator